MHDLSFTEQEALAWLIADESRMRSGGGPWERAYVQPPRRFQQACRRLARLGLVERRDPGYHRDPIKYRWIEPD